MLTPFMNGGGKVCSASQPPAAKCSNCCGDPACRRADSGCRQRCWRRACGLPWLPGGTGLHRSSGGWSPARSRPCCVLDHLTSAEGDTRGSRADHLSLAACCVGVAAGGLMPLEQRAPAAAESFGAVFWANKDWFRWLMPWLTKELQSGQRSRGKARGDPERERERERGSARSRYQK